MVMENGIPFSNYTMIGLFFVFTTFISLFFPFFTRTIKDCIPYSVITSVISTILMITFFIIGGSIDDKARLEFKIGEMKKVLPSIAYDNGGRETKVVINDNGTVDTDDGRFYLNDIKITPSGFIVRFYHGFIIYKNTPPLSK